ncbi:MAG: FtsX-like permease family protein, partial [Acholeplasmataceae bacterium]|nr:FtsX-like permease family protein [Acholeplasmataceae bacterium]
LNEEEFIALQNDLLEHPNIESVYPVYQFSLFSNSGNILIVKGIDFEDTSTHYYKILNRRTFGNTPSEKLFESKDYDFEGEIGAGLIRNIRPNETYHRYADESDVGITISLTYSSPIGEKNVYKVRLEKIFVTDNFVIRSKVLFIDYRLAQEITGLTMPTNLDIKVNNPLISETVNKEIEPLLSDYFDEYFIKDWSLENNDIINIIYVEKVSVLIIQIITAFAIAIGLMNVLSFSVKEKTKQVGILKAMGINRPKANLIFIIQITFISIISIISGILLGYGLSVLFQNFTISSNGDNLIWMEKRIFNRYSYLTALIMFVFNLFGALIPLIRVNSLKIVEIIKNK